MRAAIHSYPDRSSGWFPIRLRMALPSLRMPISYLLNRSFYVPVIHPVNHPNMNIPIVPKHPVIDRLSIYSLLIQLQGPPPTQSQVQWPKQYEFLYTWSVPLLEIEGTPNNILILLIP